MPGIFDSFTSFINSSPGQLAAGSVLGGIVWKFFKHVGDALNEKTNKEIARWLRVKKFESAVVAGEAVNWPATFAKVFDRVFGEKHLSWKCFWRSVLASIGSASVVVLLWFLLNPDSTKQIRSVDGLLELLVMTLIFLAMPDYASLLKSRYIISRMSRTSSAGQLLVYALADITLSAIISLIALGSVWIRSNFWQPTLTWKAQLYFFTDALVLRRSNNQPFLGPPGAVFFYPALFTSLWAGLYAGSGFLLRAARHFDIALRGSTPNSTSRKSRCNQLV